MLAILAVIVSCKTPGASTSKTNVLSDDGLFSFLSLNEKIPTDSEDLDVINGRGYPRIYATAYRASNNLQLPLTKMLRGMFDDPYTPIESKTFTAMKFALAGKPLPFSISEESSEIVASLAREFPIFRNSREDEIIKFLFKKSFDHLRGLSVSTLRNKYIYYKEKTYQDFSDDIVYSTTLPYIASFYGPRLVEINEWDSPINNGSPRSADLNYLNYAKYGRWLEDGLPASMSFYWEDSEQLITPMLIDGSAVTGYQIRDRYKVIDRNVHNSWNIFEIIDKKLVGEFRSVDQPYSPIDVAFYKLKYKEETIVGVFSGKKQDGGDSTCMIRSLNRKSAWKQPLKDQIPQHCLEQKPWEDPVMSGEQAAMIGIIRLCALSCTIPPGLLTGLTTRSESLSTELLDEINKTEVLGENNGRRLGQLKFIGIKPS